MAKKKAAPSGTGAMTLKLQDKTFCVAGKFDTYGNDTRDAITAMITAEGGSIVDNVGPSIDYLLLKEPQGKSSHEKKAVQLNLKGSSITILDPGQLRTMVTPSADDVDAWLRAGPAGHQRLDKTLEAMQFMPRFHRASSFYNVDGLDLHGQDLKGIPLRCVALDNANLKQAKAEFLDENSETLHFAYGYLSVEAEDAALGPLENSNLDGSKLHAIFVKLDHCSCRDADLSFSALSGDRNPVIKNCDFTNAKLVKFHFGNPNFSGSTFQKSDLSRANIEGCTASGLDFRQARLQSTKAEKSDFERSDFTQADLSDAELMGCKFGKANLTKARFCNALLMHADFKGATLDGADFTGANVAGADFTGVNTSKVKGLPEKASRVATAGPKLKELAGLLNQSARLDTSIEVRTATQSIVLTAKQWWHHTDATWAQAADPSATVSCNLGKATLENAMVATVNCWPEAVPQAHTIQVSASKLALTPKKLKQLALEAWYETYGLPCPTAAEIDAWAKTSAAKKGEQRDQMLNDLVQEGGVERWNNLRRTDQSSTRAFPKAQLAKQSLDNVALTYCDFTGSDFSGASLANADLVCGTFNKSNFAGANLSGLGALGAKFIDCNFSSANLAGAKLTGGSLRNANLMKANLAQAEINSDLCGANLTGAKFKTCDFGTASFDETTQFPKDFVLPESLVWKGKGIDPRAQAAVAAATSGGPIDMEQFMSIMQASVDVERMKKALSMLKAERFRLFAEANGEHLIGVVKSQNDPDLVYSCRLTNEGQFACCTQNLNNCGGLRGALCKHLLVLIIGMTRGGELDPTLVNEWIAASRYKKPELDKDVMSETLLRYKGAEAGEIDWRPMETIPEDYFSL